MAFERLSACVEELRASGSAADLQIQQRKLLRELFSLDRRWSPELLAPPSSSRGSVSDASSTAATTTTTRKLSGGNGQLFVLLLQALTVYSGSHTNNSSAGASGASTMSLGATAPLTSETVLSLLCDLLVRAFDYSAVPVVNETLTAKHTSIYVKTALVVVVSKLPLSDAVPFVAEIVAFANKTIKAADYFMKQLLLESTARVLDNDLARLAPLFPDALRIVSKTFQDKVPEVRLAAAGLLHVLAQHTPATPSHSASSGGSSSSSVSNAINNSSNGSNSSSSSAGLSGSGGTTNSAPGSNSGSSTASSSGGVTHDAILYIATKGMDDAAPDARRAYSAVVGLVLAKFVTAAPDSSTEVASDSVVVPSVAITHVDDDAGRHASEQDSPVSHTTAITNKPSKLAFKMPSVHLAGMAHLNLPGALSRRKAAAVHFSTVASSIAYVRELVASRYVIPSSSSSSSSSSPTQRHGGILASFALAVTSMFAHLPADTVTASQFHDIVDATLSILDHAFALSDLTRARNAVGFVLRHGLFPCLTEQQQHALLGTYVTKLEDEATAAAADDSGHHHHKILAVLVEMSHMFQAMGEACVSHAHAAAQTLQTLLAHAKQSVRFQASVALASLVTALPYTLKRVLTSCVNGLRATATLLLQAPVVTIAADDDTGAASATSDANSLAQLYVVQGRSAAIAHMLRAVTLRRNGDDTIGSGLAHATLTDILTLAEQLIASQVAAGCIDSVWLTCTRAGWTLVSSVVAVDDPHWVRTNTPRLLALWRQASELLHTPRESSLELLRIEGAVIALHAFLSFSQHDNDNVVTHRDGATDSVEMLAAHILSVFLAATQERLSNPLKRRGQVARVRVITWLLKAFVLLPPIFSDAYIVLLDLIAEYTVAQSLTSLRTSALAPPPSTFLTNALTSADDVLEVATTSRLVAGDRPSALYSRELNHVLALLQHEHALGDTELEVQYMDTFWAAVCDARCVHDVAARALCSSFTDVRLVDASVLLFGRVFHFVPEELQLRCLQHFAGALADAPRGTGTGSCDVNVVSLLFAAIFEAKRSDGPQLLTVPTTAVWPQQMQTMLCELLGSDHARVRRGAGEALGLLAALMTETHCKALVSDIEKRLVLDRISSSTSSVSASATSVAASSADPFVQCAGAAFALACIKRVCGSRISIDTGLLYRVAAEVAQPLRTWILYAWSLVIESVHATGDNYEQYVKTTVTLLDAHVLAGFTYSKTNKRGLRYHASAQLALAKIVNAVVAGLGPELASGHAKRLREFHTLYALLRECRDARVELEHLKFLEQVIVFAPARVRCSDLATILSVVSDVATFVPSANGSNSHFSGQLAPSSTTTTALSEQLRPSVNGTARSVLQHVALSCIRTLVEREPRYIARARLERLLFHALHVASTDAAWQYMPRVHGMWDDVSFQRAVLGAVVRSSDGVDAIRATISALVDIDAMNTHSDELIVWALLCRSIAVGESHGSSDAEQQQQQLMMSPKGMDLPGLAATSRFGSSANDDTADDWGFGRATPTTVTTTDSSVVLMSDAIAAQLDVWRDTKRAVRDRIGTLPPLARPVRQFAVECVLRVLDLVATGSSSSSGSSNGSSNAQIDAALHFDLAAARAHALEQLHIGASTDDGAATTNNFVCMYLDEFVTLACYAATASADSCELQMFQSAGLRLLHVLVRRFAAARDPEVATGDAFVLDPYQAQIMSAIRQALKQASVSSDNATTIDAYAPLLIEAFGICGGAVATRLVVDKVALGRVLKVIATDDFGHAHCISSERTRVTLALANVAAVAQMLSASIVLADKDSQQQQRSRIDDVATSPLVKVFVATFTTTAPYVVQCWRDVALSYSVVMRGSAPWPRASDDDSSAVVSDKPQRSRVLGTLLPEVAAADADAVRELYRCYWPHVLQALVLTRLHLPRAFPDIDAPHTSRLLLACAVFHIRSTARLARDELLQPVVQSLPLLLQSLEQDDRDSAAAAAPKTSDFASLYESGIETLVHVAMQSVVSDRVRVEALQALQACLTRDTIAYYLRQVASDAVATQRLNAVLAQAALCPIEILRQLSAPHKSKSSSSSSNSSSSSTQLLLDVVQCATAGVVLLHTTASLRCYTVHAVALVAQCYSSIADCVALHDRVVALTRAAVESTVAFARTDAIESATAAMLCNAFSASARVLLRVLLDTLKAASAHSAVAPLDFALRLLATFAVAHAPAVVATDLTALHAASAQAAAAALDTLVCDDDSAQHNALVAAHILRGLYAVTTKLFDAGDAATARWYVAALVPALVSLVERYARNISSISSTSAVGELEQVAALLKLLAAQMDEVRGTALVHALLPTLAAVLQIHATSVHRTAVVAALGQLLLSFAQTRAAAFKAVVVALDPVRRSVLELALRSALTGGAAAVSAAAATSAPSGSSVRGKPLDLSRYS